MCGRFTLTRSAAEVAEHFELAEVPSFAPRFNIAPTQPVLAIRGDAGGGRTASLFRWGLLARGAQPSHVTGHINARLETLGERATFRDAAMHRRCLVPADGFYEWRGPRGLRQPFHLALPAAALFAMAAIWEPSESESAEGLASLAIVTTAAAPNVAALHDRMPLIVDPAGYAEWLGTGTRDIDAILAALPATRASRLGMRAVSWRVNDARTDDARCLEPAEQGTLL
jgi:putative SOS response-associated peptidase YedK